MTKRWEDIIALDYARGSFVRYSFFFLPRFHCSRDIFMIVCTDLFLVAQRALGIINNVRLFVSIVCFFGRVVMGLINLCKVLSTTMLGKES